jgi:hypothetical protein
MDYVEQAKITATALENEGYDARLNEQPLATNPYVRRSKEWEMWRLGWARGDYDSRRGK